jgi:glycosyl hydrolase family 42 (putative beta-galactosidase)
MLMSKSNIPPSHSLKAAPDSLRISMPGSPFGIATGFLYGYQGTPAFEFMPEVRKLGANFSKAYFFWNQLEPEKGKYDWTAVDKYIQQLNSPEEGLIAVFSSSQWATTRSSTMLPPSPAKSPDEYFRFIFDLVKHCRGRVRFWQNDAEPNNPIYWAGSKEEFVAELKLFHKAVKDAAPSAIVVVGGYDGLFGPPGTHQFPNQQAGLDFFDYVFKEGRQAFDIFDLRLYGDPYTIEPRVHFMRQKMLALGFEKPIICAEYGGPNLFEFAENRQYIPMVVAWGQSVMKREDRDPESGNASETNPLRELYAQMATLAPQTQMFMQGCSPELEAKYQRIQARNLVMRNLFALSAGVQKTIYWDLPRVSFDEHARYHMMVLMYGKIGLVQLENGELKARYPTADAFERMTTALRGVDRVTRIEIPDRPSIFLFEVTRAERDSMYVIWERRDAFCGEDSPAVAVALPWHEDRAVAVDALGQAVSTRLENRLLHLEVSLTPIFVEPGGKSK